MTTTALYVGMRRGGRVLYAFNVTDIVAATPQAPQLLWKRGCPVNLTGTARRTTPVAPPATRISARPGRRPRS